MIDGKQRIARMLGVLTILGCLMFGAQALEPVPGGALAAYWSFDAAISGNTQIADLSGNNNTATLIAAPTLVAAQFGNGLQFGGGTQRLTVPANASLDVGTGSFSISPVCTSATWRNCCINSGTLTNRAKRLCKR